MKATAPGRSSFASAEQGTGGGAKKSCGLQLSASREEKLGDSFLPAFAGSEMQRALAARQSIAAKTSPLAKITTGWAQLLSNWRKDPMPACGSRRCKKKRLGSKPFGRFGAEKGAEKAALSRPIGEGPTR